MSKQEFLTSSGLEVQTLEFWLEQQWLIPEESSAGARFSDRDVARARLIGQLKSDFGVNDEGVDVILHLMDQLHGMRRALAQLQEHMGGKAG
ncbi:MAG: MerR family transcriptional regulator [Hyphomicrobiales bacterium]|nr:MerR family transcriptional regulator [Hyphomicrobiales bacterium]MBV9054585.1 MerR family transcriptional regulator [Hyphomicrobiales bacterium]MBV9977606.1 MerR family transcriptional regulator [Hyphomicrobiales bacterium]